MAGRLRVSRLTGVLDRYRKWDVVLDGEVVGSVANGQTCEVLVECGTHAVRVGHRWWASRHDCSPSWMQRPSSLCASRGLIR